MEGAFIVGKWIGGKEKQKLRPKLNMHPFIFLNINYRESGLFFKIFIRC